MLESQPKYVARISVSAVRKPLYVKGSIYPAIVTHTDVKRAAKVFESVQAATEWCVAHRLVGHDICPLEN